jgi:hypothetical protein
MEFDAYLLTESIVLELFGFCLIKVNYEGAKCHYCGGSDKGRPVTGYAVIKS